MNILVRGALALSLLLLIPPPVQAQEREKGPARHKPDEVLVRFKEKASLETIRGRLAGLKAEPVRGFRVASMPDSPINRLYLMKLRDGWSVKDAVAALARRPDVELAQPNYLYHKEGSPDDPYFSLQWGFHNTGQAGTRGPLTGLSGADMDTPEAWTILETSLPPLITVVVGVIDTGVDYTHPDLASQMWINPGEIPGNGADDDGNGYVDDIHGWDFAYSDSDPMDGDGHGTHVSGSIAAATNNGIGGAGTFGPVDNVRIMALKFLDDSGSGSTADAIDAINYGIYNGATVLNNSWGGGGWDQELYDAIDAANTAGITFVASAGNEGLDNEQTHHYPSDYDLPNVVSVAAHDRRDLMAEFSNWGIQSVDLAAPGDEILSTVPGSDPVTSYDEYGGTSMATPHVTGAMAILYAQGLAPTPAEGIARLLEGTDPSPAYHGIMASSGRLNVNNILERALGTDTHPPDPVTDLVPVAASPGAITLGLTATGDDGLAGQAHRYILAYEEAASWTGFPGASKIRGGWIPSPAGFPDYLAVPDLLPGTGYTIQVQVLDDVGNASLSNEVTVATDPGDTALFSEDFESGLSGWTAESPWGVTGAEYHSPVQSATDSPGGSYPTDMDASLTSPPIDLSTVGEATLTYWERYDFESGWDFGYVEVRDTGGSSWSTIHSVTGTNTTWHAVTLDLAPFAGSVIQIRFHAVSDYALNQDGWYIDDVEVKVPPAGVLIFEDSFDDLSSWSTPPGSDFGIEAGMLTDSPGGDYALDRVDGATLASPLDLSGAGRVLLSFDLASVTEANWDYFFVETSTDGTYWSEVARWTGTHPIQAYSFDLSHLGGHPGVWLRFRLNSDYLYSYDGAQVDNLRVEVIPPADGDTDGTPDFRDCAPGDGSAFAPAGEITNVLFLPDDVTIQWDSQAGSTGPGILYDVLRGDPAGFPVGSPGTEVCHEPNAPANQSVDASIPPPGTGYYYLVRGVNSCGIGTYGFDSAPAERLSGACP